MLAICPLFGSPSSKWLSSGTMRMGLQTLLDHLFKRFKSGREHAGNLSSVRVSILQVAELWYDEDGPPNLARPPVQKI
jgi:hypothetical protein